MRLFLIYLKTILRSRTLVFWTLIFPIILSILFSFAFSNLNEGEKFHPVDAGVVTNEALTEEAGFLTTLEAVSEKGDADRVLNLRKYASEKEAAEALAAGKITGYYYVEKTDSPAELTVGGSGLDQTILKEVADEYFQGVEIVRSIYQKAYGPDGQKTLAFISQRDPAEAYAEALSGGSVFKDIKDTKTDNTIIYFYTLIGMVCMYGASFGIYGAEETEANLSKRAARVSVSPVRKSRILAAVNLAGYVTLYIETILVILFMDKVLGVAFGDQLGYILLLSAAGCFAGLSFGVFIGAAGRGSAEAKQGATIGLTMGLCFLGGMMYQEMRYIIKDHAPLLDAINPVTMITDGLYSLYCYTDHALLWNAVLRLVAFGAVFFAASLFFTGRKTYDHI